MTEHRILVEVVEDGESTRDAAMLEIAKMFATWARRDGVHRTVQLSIVQGPIAIKSRRALVGTPRGPSSSLEAREQWADEHERQEYARRRKEPGGQVVAKKMAKQTIVKAHKIADKIGKRGGVRNPFAVGMAVAKRSAAKRARARGK